VKPPPQYAEFWHVPQVCRFPVFCSVLRSLDAVATSRYFTTLLTRIKVYMHMFAGVSATSRRLSRLLSYMVGIQCWFWQSVGRILARLVDVYCIASFPMMSLSSLSVRMSIRISTHFTYMLTRLMQSHEIWRDDPYEKQKIFGVERPTHGG